jgi:hypothetical protein
MFEGFKINYLLYQEKGILFHRIFNSHISRPSKHSSIIKSDLRHFSLFVKRDQCLINQRLPTKFHKNLHSNRFLNREKSPKMHLFRNLELKRLKCCLAQEINLNIQKEKNIHNFYLSDDEI